MFQDYLDLLMNNEIAQGLVLAGPVSVLFYIIKDAPGKVFNRVANFFSYTLVFKSDLDREYYEISKFVNDNIVRSNWSRNFSFDHIKAYNPDTDEQDIKISEVGAGYGSHWGFYNRTPVRVTREMEDTNNNQFKETLTLKFFAINSKKLKELGTQISDLLQTKSSDTRLKVRINSADYWSNGLKIPKRDLSSVFINDDKDKIILDHIQNFSKSRDEYLRKGIPWHTGVLLSGPPGSGKTSLIHALASESNRDIAFLNLSSVESDHDLMSLMTSNQPIDWQKMLLVIEDIDVSRAATDRENESETITLSSLLNMLDGLTTPDGIVTIATTNRLDKLDPALIRSGRFDLSISLDKLSWKKFIEMSKLYRS